MIEFLYKINQSFIEIKNVLVALLKILIYTKFSLKKLTTSGDSFTFLANGPSLTSALEKMQKDNIDFSNVMVSNYFNYSALFDEIRPNFYIICDPAFILQNEKNDAFFSSIFKKVCWKMTFFIPISYKKKMEVNVLRLNLENPNILFHYYNSINLDGNSSLIHWFYKKGWGMPSPTTVAVAGVYQGIFMNYKKIQIAGIDLNMHQSIRVNSSNVLEIQEDHFYADEPHYRTFYKNVNSKTTFTSAEIFLIFHRMIASFDILSKFAKKKNSKIINYSNESFLDQFIKK